MKTELQIVICDRCDYHGIRFPEVAKVKADSISCPFCNHRGGFWVPLRVVATMEGEFRMEGGPG